MRSSCSAPSSGFQKLANPAFLDAGAPGSFAAQVRAAETTSPLHHLLAPALHAPTLPAVVIALGELAVGAGTLVGLFARAAAAGGMLLSLTFFLTVSFGDSPYYYGADIVFLFAWTPFLLGGAGALSLDGWLAERRAEQAAVASLAPGASRALGRRAALGRLGAFGALGALVLALGGAVAAVGRALAPRDSSAASSSPVRAVSGSTPAGARLVAREQDVPVGGAAFFTDPIQQVPAYVVQPEAGTYRAFSAVCTHAGCQVAFHRATETFNCPCHGSSFDAATGDVLEGPALRPLPEIGLSKAADGGLYVTD